MFTIPCHGDALTVERIFDGKRARAAGHSRLERLEGIHPVPQEFHKRAILLQDTMDMLFNGQSAPDKGTLFNIKNVFNHRNLKKKVMDNFNHVEDFLKFTTAAMVSYLAMMLCGISKLTDKLTLDVPEASFRQFGCR
ncbi:PREDICTED: uncharacterized protein LOC106813191 [Priapulus caudatus]|uniref:Uncharacterized protein LOC106813191 n=1 Tax=Priapulus caudatus TaxID=37621 RepID=A0ABM1EKM4_PRICU|nr:PREDICTED: uncharacterized protein LOC106813191 [Priapulus caudatus]